MRDLAFALFETAIGHCAIVWSARGVAGVQLPELDARATRARVARRFPAAREQSPPPGIRRTIDDIVALLRGKPIDLSNVTIDDAGTPEFNAQVYAITRTISAGPDVDLRRNRRTARQSHAGARSRNDFRAKSLSDHHAVPSCTCCRRQDRWFFCQRWCGCQAKVVDHRRCTAEWPNAV